MSINGTSLSYIVYERDDLGRVKTQTDREYLNNALVTTRFDYDASGRLWHSIVGGVTTTFTDDANGNLIRGRFA